MARSAITAMLAGDDEAFDLIMSETDPEVYATCCHVLVGMMAAQVTKSAHGLDLEPSELWRRVIAREMAGLGF